MYLTIAEKTARTAAAEGLRLTSCFAFKSHISMSTRAIRTPADSFRLMMRSERTEARGAQTLMRSDPPTLHQPCREWGSYASSISSASLDRQNYREANVRQCLWAFGEHLITRTRRYRPPQRRARSLPAG